MTRTVVTTSSNARPAIVVDGLSFALNGNNVSYRFHVDEASGDLIGDHFGGVVDEDPIAKIVRHDGGWSNHAHERREFPDLGRGDFRVPALHIKHKAGHTVSDFKYKSHSVAKGKPALPGLPCTFGSEDEVTTLVLRLEDTYRDVVAELSYSIFPGFDAIARSVRITNNGPDEISIEKLASFSVDFPYSEYEILQLQGEWTRECNRIRRKVDYGMQGFGSSNGYSSHYNNPFLALVTPGTTESSGDAWGFSLVYTGSFNVEVEMNPQGLTRALVGMNPYHLSWPLKPGESFVSPECVSVFSNNGVGAMSRKYHRLYRQHLIKSKFVNQPRPVLLNGWEGVYFDFDDKVIYNLAEETAKLGIKLFVLDDGWFGNKYPRLNDHSSLGDWQVNRARFPDGLGPLVEKVKKLRVAGSEEALQFGLWVEPEMISQKSELYEKHPEWALHAGQNVRSENRNQLVLNVALPEVQDFIIKSLSDVLEDAPITYIKWDNNRGMHESPSPQNHHAYMLGMYRVFEELTTKFPNVIWEGCASGGGRFDAGILQYFPQVWTSDGTDALDRIHIQFGTSLVYPASTMGAHLSAVPNEVTGRTTPLKFRAHVAMMGGSFGLELDPRKISDKDRAELPGLIALAEKINPTIITGDMYRLVLPESSNFPAAIFVSEDGSRAVLFAFQLLRKQVHNFPTLRLQGLDTRARYRIDGKDSFSGASLMNGGIQFRFTSDYDSRVSIIERI